MNSQPTQPPPVEEEVVSRPNIIGEQIADEKIKKLDTQLQDITNKVHLLIGGMSLVGLIFVAIGILGGWRFLQQNNDYNNFQNSRGEVNKLLIKQIEVQTADVFNKLTLTGVSKEQKRRVDELDKNVQSLNNIQVDNEKFTAIKELIRALKEVVQNNNPIEARQIVDRLANHTDDKFVSSRALALRALISIALDRNSAREIANKDLKDAIELDGTNAIAFNSLGMRSVSEAIAELEKGNLDAAKPLMRQAAIEFRLAGALDSSLEGAHKYRNNVTWCNLLLIQGFLNKEGANSAQIPNLLSSLNYKNANEFFDESRKELDIYRRIAPALPGALETTAQSMFLEAQYKRSQIELGAPNSQELERQATELESKGAEIFAEAIASGLYERVRTKVDAEKQFDHDFLHQYFIKQNPAHAVTLRDKIDKWFATNT